MSYFNPTQEEIDEQIAHDLKVWDHFAKWCYSDKQDCISCGCYPPSLACPAHIGSRRYQNYLMERMVRAQEKLAGIE